MEVITTHINADFDCLGGMIAAKKLYPEALLVFAGAQERSLREFFLRSAVYAFDFKRPRDIDLDAIRRLILVDVRQSDRIGPFGEVARRPGIELHIYDHHTTSASDLKGSLEVIEPVGSTVTVFSHLFMERGIEPEPLEATMMMLGLYEDTGNLLFNSTTLRDYQAAAFLFSCGAQLNTVADFLTQELTADQVDLLHQLVKSLTILNINGLDVAIAHASVEHFVADLAVLGHKLKDMENLNALVVVVRMGDRIFLVGRSRLPEVPMGDILGEFGGGGHAFAASATIRELTLVQVLEQLPQIMAKHVQPRWEARHLMSAPVRTVSPQESIERVRHVLNRYNINALPVVADGQVVGITTRQVADKAAHHDLGSLPVQEFMATEFATAAPNTPLETLQELIVGRNQRFVPVVDNSTLVGAITRTDLLRHLVSGALAVHRQDGGKDDGPALKKRHITRLLREQLPTAIQEMLRQMGGVGDDLGVSVFVVGGFVRDLLLRQKNLDLDIVVEGDGIAFAAEFARRHNCRIRPHHKFGTAVIIFPDDFKVDVASTRTEYYLEPGALPTVEHASIKLDLYRRDFTINTLAIALNPPDFGELLDFFGAQRDLQEKALRVLHNLSFIEDPTRVFRAIRFEQRLGFQMGKHTEQLLRSAARMGFIEKVGGPRVLNELIIILREAHPYPAVARMAELDLLKYIHPLLQLKEGSFSLFEGASRAIHWYELLYTGVPCRRWLVYLLCLTADLDRDALEGIGDRLSIPGRYRDLLGEQRERVHRILGILLRRQHRRRAPVPSELYRLFSPLAVENLLYLMARTDNDEVRRWISLYFTRLRQTAPLLTGRDLKEMGVPPGPMYKKILAVLRDARLDGRLSSREDEIAVVRKRFLRKEGIRD
jgi:tRNA nucleotidyltransferase (CCA-adding enzyme)